MKSTQSGAKPRIIDFKPILSEEEEQICYAAKRRSNGGEVMLINRACTSYGIRGEATRRKASYNFVKI